MTPYFLENVDVAKFDAWGEACPLVVGYDITVIVFIRFEDPGIPFS